MGCVSPRSDARYLLKKYTQPVEVSKRAKPVILLDDMLVESHRGCSFLLTLLLREKIQWSADKFSEFTQAVNKRLGAKHDPPAL
jgi:hypothetical protein